MTYVGATPTTGDFKKLDSITTSSATTFNLRQGGVAVYPQSANHCLVVLNGVLLTAGSSFNIVNDTIVFASSLRSMFKRIFPETIKSFWINIDINNGRFITNQSIRYCLF